MSETLHYSSATHNQIYFAEHKYNKVVVSKNLLNLCYSSFTNVTLLVDL